MSLFGRWSELAQFQTVRAVRTHFGVGDDHWACFTRTVGDFQDDLRVLAAFPRTGLLAGVSQSQFPDGTGLTPVQATQIGLVWRLARRVIAHGSGMDETEFQDMDPWQETNTTTAARQSHPFLRRQREGSQDVDIDRPERRIRTSSSRIIGNQCLAHKITMR